MPRTYDLSHLSFLIVDDNHHMLSIIKTLLRGFGVKSIHDATDAIQAFEAFRSSMIDIIILDYYMDSFDGVEFTRMVRTADDSSNKFVPIIMVTAFTERARVEQARDIGITELLVKPVSAMGLYRRIIEVIEHPRPFVKSGSYFGPCRRRQEDENYAGPERRKDRQEQAGAA